MYIHINTAINYDVPASIAEDAKYARLQILTYMQRPNPDSITAANFDF